MTPREIFLELMKITLSASIVALMVMVLRLIFRKAPRWQLTLLWLLVAVRLVIPTLPESRFSLIPAVVGSGTVVTQLADVTVPKAPTAAPGEGIEPESEAWMTPTVLEGEPIVGVIPDQKEHAPEADSPVESGIIVNQESREAPKTLGDTVFPILFWVWLAGTAVMLCYMAVSYWRVWKKSRLSVLREGNIYYCDEPGSPFVFGLFRPRICLPSTLSEEAYECVLAHEKAHIARKDPLWKLLGSLLLSVYWFNPIFWLSYVLFCRDIEKACDERTLRDRSFDWRRTYSDTLLSLSTPKHWISTCPVAFGEVGVKSRVKAALRFKESGKWLIVVLAVVTLLTAVSALTNRPAASSDPSKSSISEENQPVQFDLVRFMIYSREGDAAGDGWIYTFSYEDLKNRSLFTLSYPKYKFSINNVRYWEDDSLEISYQCLSTSNRYRAAGFTENIAGLERDLTLIGELLKDGTDPKTLLALDPASVEFEVLDKEQFFRLMRNALTGELKEPKWQKSFDTLYERNYYREHDYEDGYVFRFACLKGWGFIEETFLDVAYGTEGQYVLLSDLVDQGKATAEQTEAFELLRSIAESLKGQEYDYAYGADAYRDKVIGGIDFGRLYTMMTRLTENVWEEEYRPFIPEPESLPLID